MSTEGPSGTPAPISPNEARCWACGAPNDPAASECWLCQRRDWRRRPAGANRAGAKGPSEAMGVVRLGALFLAFLSMMFAPNAPGVAIIGLFLVFGGWAFIEAGHRRRKYRGRRPSCLELLIWAVMVAFAMFVALIVGVFAVCFFSVQ